jgi:hypothetical protein
MDKLAYSYAEAAEATGISQKELQRAVAENRLVASYPNSRPVFLSKELDRFLESLPTERKP